MPQYYTHDGEPLYALTELARLSNISPKILRKWLDNGDMINFITTYVDPESLHQPSPTCYYKLGLPAEEDQRVPETNYYHVRFGQMDPQKELERRQRLAELEDQPRLLDTTIAGRAEVNRFYSEVCDD